MLAPIFAGGDGVDAFDEEAKGGRNERDGSVDDTGWTGVGDGFLVIDRDGDGRITSAAELSFLTEKATAKSDLDALSALDSNRDGKIDKNDARFGELKVWVDADGDGVTDGGELRPLPITPHLIVFPMLSSGARSVPTSCSPHLSSCGDGSTFAR